MGICGCKHSRKPSKELSQAAYGQKILARSIVVIVVCADEKRAAGKLRRTRQNTLLHSGHGSGNPKHPVNRLLIGFGHLLDWRFQRGRGKKSN